MSSKVHLMKAMLRFLIPVIIIGVGVFLARTLIHTGPKAERRSPPPQQALVEVITAHPTNVTVVIRATGTVVPSHQVRLRSQVAGQILETSDAYQEGGFLTQGEMILTIDPADYQLAVSRAQATLTEAEFQLKVEQGRQDVARREWELIGDADQSSPLQRELALRKPHLEAAQAAVQAARASLDQAELQLARTTITAPFDATVVKRMVDRGAYVSSQDTLAEVAATEAFWVEVAVPVRDLARLSIPVKPGEAGSAALIRNAADSSDRVWTGSVLRLIRELDTQSRLARLVVAIPDPLDLKSQSSASATSLLLGSFVRVDLLGTTLEDVVVLPRVALRDQDSVWIMTGENTLEVRPVVVDWKDETRAAIRSGIAPGEQVILSNLGTPVPGMNLVAAGKPEKTAPPQGVSGSP